MKNNLLFINQNREIIRNFLELQMVLEYCLPEPLFSPDSVYGIYQQTGAGALEASGK